MEIVWNSDNHWPSLIIQSSSSPILQTCQDSRAKLQPLPPGSFVRPQQVGKRMSPIQQLSSPTGMALAAKRSLRTVARKVLPGPGGIKPTIFWGDHEIKCIIYTLTCVCVCMYYIYILYIYYILLLLSLLLLSLLLSLLSLLLYIIYIYIHIQ